MEWTYALFPLLGVGVGFLAGLLGIGGGAVMVPVLVSLFLAAGYEREIVVHLALGTSMAVIVVTSFSSARAHAAKGGVLYRVLWPMAAGVIPGALGASYIAQWIPGVGLGVFFSLFLLYVAYQLFFQITPKPQRSLPAPFALAGVGAGIGAVSSWVAIGGGSLTVPFLTWCNVPMRQAIGTSAALGVPISFFGSLGYLLADSLPLPWTTGSVHWPAALGIAATSVVTAPWGARIAHRLKADTLKRLFALLLIGLSAKMLWTLL